MKAWRHRCLIVPLVCLLVMLAGRAKAAQEPNGPGKMWKSFEVDTGKFPDRFLADAKDTFWNVPNAAALGLAGIGTAVFQRNYDDKIDHHFETTGHLSKWVEDPMYVIGNPGTQFGITGVWYGIAAANGDELNRQRAVTMMSALAITGAATVSLKLAANNDCPNGAEYGWPSGHTSTTVCFAAVLDEFYGPEVGIPAYLFAGFMGYRMMDTEDHWASDVLFGAVLGYVVGHTVAGKAKKVEIAGFSLVPYSGNDGTAMGLGLAKQF
jgi:membrane-associated phospholipid phosphatase